MRQRTRTQLKLKANAKRERNSCYVNAFGIGVVAAATRRGGLELTRPGTDCSFVAATTAALAALVPVRHCAGESAQPNDALCATVCVCVCEALCACVCGVFNTKLTNL